MKLRFLTAVMLVSAFGLPSQTSPPALKPEEMPRVAPLDTNSALKSFAVRKGFHLEVAVAEPLILDPIDLCFDENGRLFVVEMRDYSEMRDVTPHLGRVRMLEDTDGDGVFDRATVHVDDLPWPTSVFYFDGGIFVIASPDILYCKDTNGDGKADVRRVVFTGFGAGVDRLNMQALPNCLRWGLDNRIHGQTAGNGGLITRPGETNLAPLALRGRDFNFNPRTLHIQAEAGGGQYGMAYDDRGRKFACSNSRHIIAFMYDVHYAERNPFYNMPAPLVDIPVDGPAAEVFRTSPEEMWRVIRTKWRVAGLASGPIEGGGRASGYFTSATGIQIYRGDAFPEEYVGDAFIADVGSNLIHRKKVRRNGVALLAERPPDEQKVEFITSTDLWFRPVQLANAPDGCLYLCDMYREVIEHPWSLPETIKQLLDLNSGNDRGRIYRIAPDGFKPRKPPQLGKASTAELVATLEHKNAWHRETAARLLYERQDLSAVPRLAKLLQESKAPLARLHAVYALDGLGALKEGELLTALRDADAAVREHAIKLSEKFISDGVVSASLWESLRRLAGDPDDIVRYQLAFTLGEMKGKERIAPLAEIARRDVESMWTQAAILSSLAEGGGEMFAELSSDVTFRNSASGQDLLRQLAILVGARDVPRETAAVLDFVSQLEDRGLMFTMTRALGDGLQRAKKSILAAGDRVRLILLVARGVANDGTASEALRLPAIQLLAHTSYADSGSLLLGLLDLKHPQPVQLAALATLARFTDAQIGLELTQRWDTLTPRLRAETLSILLARPDRATALLSAIKADVIRASALDSTQVKLLSGHRDPAVRQLAAQVLAAKPASSRQEVINKFLPALSLKGNAQRGRKIYEERCISCHRLGGEGYLLGPDLITVKSAGNEKLLANIIDPNAEVRPEYVGYVVETRDDESLLGLVVNETGTSVTLRQAYGKEDVIPRVSITSMKSQGQSIMPEGLEAGLTQQQMADLLEYISAAKE